MDNTKIKIAMDDVDAPYTKEEYKLTEKDCIQTLKYLNAVGLQVSPKSKMYKVGKKHGLIDY